MTGTRRRSRPDGAYAPIPGDDQHQGDNHPENCLHPGARRPRTPLSMGSPPLVFYHPAACAARGRIFPAPARGNPAPRVRAISGPVPGTLRSATGIAEQRATQLRRPDGPVQYTFQAGHAGPIPVAAFRRPLCSFLPIEGLAGKPWPVAESIRRWSEGARVSSAMRWRTAGGLLAAFLLSALAACSSASSSSAMAAIPIPGSLP